MIRPSHLAVAVLVVLVGAGLGLLLAPSGHPAGHVGGSAGVTAALPSPARGFRVPVARPLDESGPQTRWAPVLRATVARERPDPRSPVVVAVGRSTPEGTTNLVVADGETTRDGRTWVHARLAVLPDGRTGWIPRAALGGWSFVDTRLVVDLHRLRLTLYRGDRVVLRVPIGVGAPGTPTPTGSFYVRDRLTGYASPSYGPLAFGTSARSEHETGWPAGGFIGIHGTDRPDLIPGRISHGCIRLRDAAIRTLGALLPIGTPVTIR